MNQLPISEAAIEKFLEACDGFEKKFYLSFLANEEEPENPTGPEEECNSTVCSGDEKNFDNEDLGNTLNYDIPHKHHFGGSNCHKWSTIKPKSHRTACYIVRQALGPTRVSKNVTDPPQ